MSWGTGDHINGPSQQYAGDRWPWHQYEQPHNQYLFHGGCGCNYWPSYKMDLPLILNLAVKKLHPDAKIPEKGTQSAAAFDLFCVENVILRTGRTIKIKTGIALEIPEGYFGLIRDRSGLASKGIITVGGVIDSDYRGEVLVCQTLSKTSKHFDIDDTEILAPDMYEYQVGDKIAQLLILPVPQVLVYDVGDLELSNTERADKGFGSTGK